MGPRRSGKTSIQRVVFYKMSPHETLFLESTNALDIKYVANNAFVQFQIWDFPGDVDLRGELSYGGQPVSEQVIFGASSALVLVIDAQDEPYQEAVMRLVEIVRRAQAVNPNISFEVFIHKVDGDLFLSDEHKIDCQRDIQQYITEELNDANLDVSLSYYLTSIYDHSIFEAFSKVVQKLVPQLPTLENLLNCLISNCNMEKSFLFDVVSRIYLATDSNPVDMQSYELCSDMIDVVIDVSCIYGMRDDGANAHDGAGSNRGEESEGMAYDSESSSVIRLNNGMVLYLREVNAYLALVCLLRADNFHKKGLIDYNINCFKAALSKVFLGGADQQQLLRPALEQEGQFSSSPRSREQR
ncbi:Gtr1/RagA G protein conserved region-domain-containing protein [Tribonema minus]|uniref:Gtr1/RagA G protein conserved region-domain-containing protein n=1 Tax=Tribonema minus TaxID=303371 RepID=A0A835Z2X6_9STRA|nr:Gtr1/RagA G protein conserved region-domain-containing protein [Tribonema minus]